MTYSVGKMCYSNGFIGVMSLFRWNPSHSVIDQKLIFGNQIVHDWRNKYSLRKSEIIIHLKAFVFARIIFKPTISQASKPVKGGHLDDKCKNVINERVKGLIGEHSPRKMCNRLELVVDEQLRCHHDKT